ncbi:MAG: carboxypeptidase-like regulatory domain-containing protein [Parcubacteria group bacterium]|jgi:type II secretory pathway pseudopilin PulG
MKKQKKQIKNKAAFTLIEALVVLFIFALITSTFYSVFSLGSKYIIESKNRLAAVQVANEKMEIVRNLKYDNVGIIGGIPNGVIPENEDLTLNTRSFHIRTFVRYEDDVFDGVYPADPIPNDYKTVKVTISWPGPNGVPEDISLTARFVPPGLEVANPGEGVLAINVLSNIENPGIGIPQSSVHVVNNAVSPAVNFTAQTDDTGNLIFPGAKESTGGYELTVTKSGYETIGTIDGSTVDYNHTDVHASVVQGAVNLKTIYQDKLASLEIRSINQLEEAIPSLSFHVKGGRVLGIDNANPSSPENVYNLKLDAATNASGEKDFTDKSPGQYFLSDIGAVAGHTLVGVGSITEFDPVGKIYTLSLTPGETKTVEVKFADNNADALRVTVLKDADNLPLVDATVKLTNGSGYSAEIVTLADGVAFYPTGSEPLLPGEYNIEIKAVGFQDYGGTVTVDKLTMAEIKLLAN